MVDLTPDLADALAPSFTGYILTTMSSPQGAGNDSFFEGLKTIVECVDLLELPFKAIEIVEKLNHWINGPGPDPVVETLERIDAALARIEDAQLGTWNTARGENLAFLRAHSSSALQTAKAFLEDGRPRNDPVWAAKIADAERDSLLAAHTFTGSVDGGYWLRPQSLKAISWAGDPRDWMAWIPDRASTIGPGQVWDHRWALPAAVYAITVRIAVLKAFDSGSATEAKRRCDEAKSYALFLGEVFHRMYAGVRHSRLEPEKYGRFTQGELPAAAVDINGGYFIESRILMFNSDYGWPAEFYPAGWQSAHGLEGLVANVSLLNHHWWNLICQKIGLADLLVLISRLQDECTNPLGATVKKLLKHHRNWFDLRVNPAAFDAVAVARFTARLGDPPDNPDDHARVLDVYVALRAGGAESRRLLDTYRNELTRIGSRIARDLHK